LRLSLLVNAKSLLSAPRRRWYRRYGLNVFCLLACLMLTLLVVEQQRVIDAQRSLIRDLFSDSLELTAMKFRAIGEARRK